MIRISLVAGLAGLVPGATVADAHLDAGTMTCGDYLGMDAESQAAMAEEMVRMVEEMGHGMMGEGEGAMMSDMMGDDLTRHVSEMCSRDGMGGMLAAEAMAAEKWGHEE